MHQERRSWRRRLEWVRDAVVRGGAARDGAKLAYLAIYLELVGTGAVACGEDGGHHRPSHHAALALQIEEALLREPSSELRPMVRAILRWLPSHEPRFRHAEPLTRIRDLAHRNDLPKELKAELKHRLQNKLHRSAGPEDLVTAAEILARVTAPGAALPPAFVAEFRTFFSELEEFFGASSLARDLAAILPALGPSEASLVRELLAVQAEPLEELELVGRVRRSLAPAWQTAAEQRRRLADLKLEQRAFVLLSDWTNRLESTGTLADLAPAIRTAAMVAEQLENIDPEHCRSLERLATGFDPADTDCLLRARARFETVRVLVDRYADQVLASYARRARELGRAVGLEPGVAREYGERKIRASLGFQLSRLADWALGMTTRALRLPPWEAVVFGTAEGRLVMPGELAELAEGAEPLVVVVRHLGGDEEIPLRVRALLVLHDLPHLSHLSLRARQGGVVLGVRRDRDGSEFLDRVGRLTRVTLGRDGLALEETETIATRRAPAPVALGPVLLESRVLELAEAALATAGAKAWGARRLWELSAGGRRGFRAPYGWVVPFGVMREGPEGAWFDELAQRVAGERSLAVRSSSNAEDLPGLSAAGLYASVIGVPPAELGPALGRVWASRFGSRTEVAMAVLVEPVVPAELSFVMVTASPFASDEVYVELAVGLGETLCSATGEGSPYRLHIRRKDRTHRLSAHASYPDARVIGPAGKIERRVAVCSEIAWGALAERLANLAELLESTLGGPQDVEGAVVGDELWVLQSRPCA
jgi:phosphoglucan,water dikinase